MRMKYLSIVRRIGKNSAMVAIARIQLETIYVRLSRGVEFNDQIKPLSERKQKAMVAISRNPVLHGNYLWLIIGLVWIMIDLFLVIITMKGDDKNTMA